MRRLFKNMAVAAVASTAFICPTLVGASAAVAQPVGHTGGVTPDSSPLSCNDGLSHTFQICFQIIGSGLTVIEMNGTVKNLTSYGGLVVECEVFGPNNLDWGPYGPWTLAAGQQESWSQLIGKNLPAGTYYDNCWTHYESFSQTQTVHP